MNHSRGFGIQSFVFCMVVLLLGADQCRAQLIDMEGSATDRYGNLLTDSTVNQNVNGLRIGNSLNGSMEVTGGLEILNSGSGSSAAFSYIGYSATGSGTATISGAGSLLSNDFSLTVGREGMGTLNIFDGGKVVNGGTGIYQGILGSSASGTGTANISGENSLWENAGDLRVGNNGTGTMAVDLGGAVTSGYGAVGFGAGSNGLATVTGQDSNGTKSSWTATGLNVGTFGTGVLNVLDGGLVTTTSSATNSIGQWGGANGTVNVSGADSKWTSASHISVGLNGTGTLNVTDGGTVSNSGYTQIGGSGFSSAGSTDGVGNVNVTGLDSLWQTGTLFVGGNGEGNLNVLSGGKATSSGSTTIGRFAAAVGTATISGSDSGTASQWLIAGNLNVGENGQGILNVLDGGYVENNRGVLGISSPGIDSVATVSGAGSHWKNGDYLQIARGHLEVSSGGLVTSVGGTIGHTDAGEVSTASINGANSHWDASGAGTTLIVGTGGGRNGTLDILDGGTVTSYRGSIGQDSSSGTSVGIVNLSGASQWNNSAELTVGYYSSGTLNIKSGSVVTNTDGHIGRSQSGANGGEGFVNVSDANSHWNNSGKLYVGNNGEGTLNVGSGGTVSNTDGHIGFNANRTGTANVDGAGSQWNNSGSLFVGIFGTGNLDVKSGGVVNSNSGIVGLNGGSTGNVKVSQGSTWNMSGGDPNVNPSDLYVGFFGTGTLDIESGSTVNNHNAFVGVATSGLTAGRGTVNVSGAGTSWNTANDLSISGDSFGVAHSGVLNISDSATVNVGGTMQLYEAGTVAGSTGGVVNFSGGKLDVATLDLTATNATENFNMTGGRLVVDTILGTFKQEGGTLAPGDSPGLTEIQNDYEMIAGMIEFEIGGVTTRGVDYDAIDVGGVATLDGTMDINWINGFTALEGDTFQLVNALGGFGLGSSPMFDFSGAGLTSGLQWDTSLFLTNGSIFVTTSVPEPTSLLMFGVACSIFAPRRRRKSHA